MDASIKMRHLMTRVAVRLRYGRFVVEGGAWRGALGRRPNDVWIERSQRYQSRMSQAFSEIEEYMQ